MTRMTGPDCVVMCNLINTCMYVCMVTRIARVWIKRVRLPILVVVSRTGKINIPLSPCVPEKLVSRDGFSRPVPRQPAHLRTQAESGSYLRDSSRVQRRRLFMKPPYAIGSVPSVSGHAIAYRWRSLPRVRRHRACKPQGSSDRVLPWQVTMNQLILASLSHTHYCYEVGMLKVPAVYICRRPGSHTCFFLTFFLLFIWRRLFFRVFFCSIMTAVCSLNGEYLVRSFLPDCVFLPCDLGLKNLTPSAYVRVQSNQSINSTIWSCHANQSKLLAFVLTHRP